MPHTAYVLVSCRGRDSRRLRNGLRSATVDHLAENPRAMTKFLDDLPPPEKQPIDMAAVAAERERCAKIAEKYVERTNADIAHAILREIRQEK